MPRPFSSVASAVAALAFALACLGAAPQVAPAARQKTPKAAAAAKPRPPPPSPPPLAAPAAAQLGASGQVDPISGLGIRNPVCDRPAQIRDSATRLSCQANGTPESNYPASNYGFDVFIDDGIDAIGGSFAKALVIFLNGIWLGLCFVLKLVLALLGLAFGLNPFGEGQTMGRIAGSIGRIYDRVTDPWLSTLVVCGGIWFAHKGLIRRELAAGVAGTLAAVAMLVAGLWVVHSPRESVGRAAAISDQVALGVIGAPQSGSLSRPSGSYAEAMSRTWARLVEVPFAGLNFSDVGWALGPPPPEAVQRADEKFCADVGALALFANLAELGSEEAKDACAQIARRRYGRPKRVIDLYLRSSPGSPARRALWRYFDKDEADRYKAKVAAQGGDGVLTRLSMLGLFALGLLGAILLLAWLAIRLFGQASIAFILLLAAPFALFFPLLGDSGRRAFKTWGLTLLGALAAKVIYAAFLSLVLAGISILGGLGGASGFLLSCAFTWSVFLKRAELVGWLSIGEAEPGAGRGLVGQIVALSAARRVARGVSGGLRSLARGGARRIGTRLAEGGEATRRTARGSLRDSARALAEQRHRDARRTVTEYEARHGRAGRAEGGGGTEERSGQAPPRAAGGASQPPAPPERERYERARALVARAERNQRAFGERWRQRDLERFAAEDRALLEGSRDPADHAHRAGYERAQFEALRGAERERAAEAIEKARKRDRQRLLAADPPGRIAGRGRGAAETLRQRGEGSAPQRREHLRGLRRERRAANAFPQRRRNLSRGG